VNGSSKGGILVCEECGERMVLDGPLWVWSSNTASFGCGKRLTLADGLNQEGSGGASYAKKATPPASPPHP
jgi:hypothetical protein